MDPRPYRVRPRLRLPYALSVGIALVAVLAGVVLPGGARASTGLFLPPHSDAGLDTDVPANGLFDYLVVSARINVGAAGGFLLVVTLTDSFGVTTITSAQKIVNLQAGLNAIEVRLDGFAISNSGIDGPYRVQLILLNDTLAFQDFGFHATSGYLATAFEPLPASFAPPHADAGVDLDSDLQFDFLEVSASIDVVEPGMYNVFGNLWDPGRTTTVAFAGNRTYLRPGAATVDLRFSGTEIRTSGINGPYEADLSLSGVSGAPMDQDTHVTGTYFISDFDAPPAFFAPPHESFVVDLDRDLFNDFLVVNGVVSVNTAGNYGLTASIPALGLVSNAEAFLSPGTQVLQVNFLGVDVFNSGMDGPYTVSLELRDEQFLLLDQDSHTTLPYFAADFEPSPPARWVPPTTDSVRDDDADLLWDALVVNATLDVDRPGDYTVFMTVWDGTFATILTSVSRAVELSTNLNTIQVEVPGLRLQISGVDGPYGVELELFDSEGRSVDTGTHVTGAYRAADFETRPAAFSPPYFDLPLDRSSPADGVFDSIAIDVGITVTSPGVFVVSGTLIGAGFAFFALDVEIVSLPGGLNPVRLEFPAVDAFPTGQTDGAFLAFLNLDALHNGVSTTIDTDTYTTQNYTAAQFDQGARMRVSGRVTARESGALLPDVAVGFWSPTFRTLVQSSTDPSGSYEAWLPRAEYFALADSPSRNAAGAAVSVAADTSLDFVLETPAPNTVLPRVGFTDWDTVDLTVDVSFVSDGVAFRFSFDTFFGDGDGVASQAEIDKILLLGNAPELPPLTRDFFTVDGTEYERVNGTETFAISGAGPIISSLPIVASVGAGYASAAPIPVQPTHRVRALAEYDTVESATTLDLEWPANFVTASFVPAPGVAVTGVGGPAATIDPGPDPAVRDFSRDAWVSLDVRTTDNVPPSVSGAALDGTTTLRSQEGPSVLVTATASDAGRGDWPIAGANYTIGPGNWATSNPMIASDGAYDGPTEDVEATLDTTGLSDGAHPVCVYAWDIVPNSNTAGNCASLVIDNAAPAVTAVRIDGVASRTVVTGASVVVTATASEASTGGGTIGSANVTRGPGNWGTSVPVAAADGSFDESSEDLTATVDTTGWAAGTYQLCVYAEDDLGNDETSAADCASVIVLAEDNSPPSISDLRADPDPADPGGTVTLSAVVTDNVDVDTVSIEILDGQGAVVANLTATYDPATGRYVASRAFPTGGTYSYRVWARDASGNWASETGTFRVNLPPSSGPSAADFWWVIAIIVVAVAILAFFLWDRRRKATGMPPAAPPAEAPPPASVPAAPEPSPPPAPEAPPPPPGDDLGEPLPPD